MRRDDPPRHPELIEPGVEIGRRVVARHLAAVDVETHTLGLVPAESDMLPRIGIGRRGRPRSEEHTSELQSLMRISYAVFCLKKKKNKETAIRISISHMITELK